MIELAISSGIYYRQTGSYVLYEFYCVFYRMHRKQSFCVDLRVGIRVFEFVLGGLCVVEFCVDCCYCLDWTA